MFKKLKYLIKDLTFLKVIWSPFKTFNIKLYFGKIAIGTPYFFPRKWVPDKEKSGHLKAVPRKVGFDFCGLGWKTKWDATDYRFEWSPTLSFVFFGYQIAVTVVAENSDEYWTAWLYYERDTDKTKSKKERIEACMKEFPLTYKVYYKDPANGENLNEETKDYYDYILKDRYKN